MAQIILSKSAVGDLGIVGVLPAVGVEAADAAPVLVEAAAAAVPVLAAAAAAHSYHNQGNHSSSELGLVYWVHHSHSLHNPAVGIHNSCSHYTGCWHLAEKPDGESSWINQLLGK